MEEVEIIIAEENSEELFIEEKECGTIEKLEPKEVQKAKAER